MMKEWGTRLLNAGATARAIGRALMRGATITITENRCTTPVLESALGVEYRGAVVPVLRKLEALFPELRRLHDGRASCDDDVLSVATKRLEQASSIVAIERCIASIQVLAPPPEYAATHAEFEQAMSWLQASIRCVTDALDNDDAEAARLSVECMRQHTTHMAEANRVRATTVTRADNE